MVKKFLKKSTGIKLRKKNESGFVLFHNHTGIMSAKTKCITQCCTNCSLLRFIESESLKVIQQLRDEAHRFAITFHRLKRSKAAIGSELNNIKGIGPSTVKELLKTFKSVKNVKTATPEALEAAVGAAKTQIILNYFNSTTSA